MDDFIIIEKGRMEHATNIAEHNILLAKETEELILDYNTALAGSTYLLTHPQYGFYLIAKHDNCIIGQAMITFEWSDWRNKMIYWIHRVYVIPEWRTKGILKKIITYLFNHIDENTLFQIRIYVHNENTKAFEAYKKIGFTETPFTIMQSSLSNEI